MTRGSMEKKIPQSSQVKLHICGVFDQPDGGRQYSDASPDGVLWAHHTPRQESSLEESKRRYTTIYIIQALDEKELAPGHVRG